MTQPDPHTPRSDVSRRNAVRAATWTVPAVAVAASTPAFAASSVSLTPHINQVALQTQLNSTLPGTIAALNANPFLAQYGPFGPYTGNGLPQCAPVDFADYDIYFTAAKNGVPAVDGSTITFTLSSNLEFFPVHSGVVSTLNGEAAPPPFRIKEGSTGTGVVTALYEGKSESVSLPISSYDDLCSIPDPMWMAMP